MTKTFFKTVPSPSTQYFIEILKQESLSTQDEAKLEHLKSNAKHYVESLTSKGSITPTDQYFISLNQYNNQPHNGCAMSSEQWVVMMTHDDYTNAIKFAKEQYEDLILNKEEDDQKEWHFCTFL